MPASGCGNEFIATGTPLNGRRLFRTHTPVRSDPSTLLRFAQDDVCNVRAKMTKVIPNRREESDWTYPLLGSEPPAPGW
jgi:hypothetical protein